MRCVVEGIITGGGGSYTISQRNESEIPSVSGKLRSVCPSYRSGDETRRRKKSQDRKRRISRGSTEHYKWFYSILAFEDTI